MTPPMQILSGAAGLAAAQSLSAASPGGLIAACANPAALGGGALELLALATAEQAVIVDAQRTPLGPWLVQVGRLAAHPAKALHRALLRAFGQGPARWGCVQLSEQVLLSGRDAPLDLASIAARHQVQAPPAIEDGLAAMAQHAQCLAQLVQRQGQALNQAGLQAVSRLEAAAVAPIAEMEQRGMPFDAARWTRLAHTHASEQVALRQQILLHLGQRGDRDLFGAAALNLDSDQELLTVLRALDYKVPNARRRTLAALPAPLGPWLERYRTLTKLASAYGTAFLDKVGSDGRLHPTFEQIGASTGRMACHSPNLQAMVKGTEHRACFRASGDRQLVVADYAACELRILAEMSGDPVFLEAFARGDDVHARVASSIFGKPVSKHQNVELRQVAKAVNFGLAYGMGPAGLARTLQMELEPARRLLQQYFRTFPRIRSFLENTARQALQRGYAQTLAGRRMDLSSLQNDPRAAERVAKNMPIQGTNADIIKIALARLRQALTAHPNSWVVNCVHDELVVECPAAVANAVAHTVQHEMVAAGAALLKTVPVTVDVQITAVWDK